MARKDIGIGWDGQNRQDVNDNFKELYDEYTEIGSNSKEAKRLAEEALDLAKNPPPKGYLESNRGVVYPLMNIIRDGSAHEVQDRVKDAILSARVIGAKPDKLYTIDWIGNGFVSQGKTLWGMQLSEYPREDSIQTDDQRNLTYFSTDDYPEPTDIIVSRTINLPDEGLIFEITYDRSKFQGTALNIAREGGRGFGCVIHHDNYVYAIGRSSGGASNSQLTISKTSNEFTVFVPDGEKFIGYSFYYVEKPYVEGDRSSNVKLWSFKHAAEYNDNLSLQRRFFTEATQDLMIRENAVNDYIGGVAHGDEVLQSVKIYVDDREVTTEDSVNLTGRELKMMQTTYLYRDTSITNGILNHVATAQKMHIVNKDGYSLDVMVEFHEEMNLRDCFIGALSMSRKDSTGQDIFREAILGGYLTEVDLTAVETVFDRLSDIDDVFVLGDGITINWHADRKENKSGARTWINNSAVAQTKLYPSYVPVNYVTSPDEIFKQKTHYLYNLSSL